jgi:DNA-binding beta-propeller fold protein YncE
MPEIRAQLRTRSTDLAVVRCRTTRMDRRRFLLAAVGLPISLALENRLASASPLAPVALVTADLESHVVVLDLGEARVLGRILTAPGPRSIERVGAGAALVAHTKHGLVSILDARERAVRFELGGFSAPRYTAAHPVWLVAYVTDSAAQEVVTVDVDRGRIVSRTQVPGPTRHISVSPDGSTLWTSLGSKAERIAMLDVREPRRPRLVRTIEPPFLAHDVVFAPGGRHAWATSGAGHRIAVYRADTREIVRVLAADRAPQHVAFAGGLAFVASGDDGTVRVHRLNGDLLRSDEVPLGSYNVTVGARHALTPSLSRGTVSVLDATGHVRAVRRVARAAHDACIVSTP